jgi:hypothetical protein
MAMSRQLSQADRTIREILNQIDEQDRNDENVIRGFAPPRIRLLQEAVNEVAEPEEINDEHGAAQPAPDQHSAAVRMLMELGHTEEEHQRQSQPAKTKSTAPTQAPLDPLPIERSLAQIDHDPSKNLARVLRGFTYAQMMQIAKELRAIEHAQFSTPEGIAALLDTWASTKLAG